MQNRLITVLQNLPPHDPDCQPDGVVLGSGALGSSDMPQAPPGSRLRKPLDQRIADSERTVIRCKNRVDRYRCKVCLEQPVMRKLLSWLASPCRPVNNVGQEGSAVKKRPLPSVCAASGLPGGLVPGHGDTGAHASHHLWHHRGVLACVACGSFSRGGTKRKLAQVCVPLPEQRGGKAPAGRTVLNRLAKGLPPDTKGGWPLEADVSPPTGFLG